MNRTGTYKAYLDIPGATSKLGRGQIKLDENGTIIGETGSRKVEIFAGKKKRKKMVISNELWTIEVTA